MKPVPEPKKDIQKLRLPVSSKGSQVVFAFSWQDETDRLIKTLRMLDPLLSHLCKEVESIVWSTSFSTLNNRCKLKIQIIIGLLQKFKSIPAGSSGQIAEDRSHALKLIFTEQPPLAVVQFQAWWTKMLSRIFLSSSSRFSWSDWHLIHLPLLAAKINPFRERENKMSDVSLLKPETESSLRCSQAFLNGW